MFRNPAIPIQLNPNGTGIVDNYYVIILIIPKIALLAILDNFSALFFCLGSCRAL